MGVGAGQRAGHHRRQRGSRRRGGARSPHRRPSITRPPVPRKTRSSSSMRSTTRPIAALRARRRLSCETWPKRRRSQRTLWVNGTPQPAGSSRRTPRCFETGDGALGESGAPGHGSSWWRSRGSRSAHPFCGREALSRAHRVPGAGPSTTPSKSVRRDSSRSRGRATPCGIHTRNDGRTRGGVAEELDVVRVLVNFAHTFGNGGGFDSGLNFTLSAWVAAPGRATASARIWATSTF